MSNEPRIPDQTISVRMPRVGGIIQHKLLPKMRVEIFGAYQFEGKYNWANKNFNPIPPVRNCDKTEWYQNLFRLRINDKWYVPGKAKYEFFTMPEVVGLVVGEKLIKIVAKTLVF